MHRGPLEGLYWSCGKARCVWQRCRAGRPRWGLGRPAAFAQPESGTCNLHNFCVRTLNWVNQVSNSIISTSSSTWQWQIWHLAMLIVVSSYIHVSQSLHMLHLVLLLAYSEHNPAKHLKPPKLVEFISLKQIMHRNIFIPTLFIEKLVVDFAINDHQHTPKLRSLLGGSGVASMSNVLQVSSVQSNTFPSMNWRGWQSVPLPLSYSCGAFGFLTLSLTVERRNSLDRVSPHKITFQDQLSEVLNFDVKCQVPLMVVSTR